MRSVPPSTMSLLGLVRHMAEVERNWFRRVTRRARTRRLATTTTSNVDGDFDDVDDADRSTTAFAVLARASARTRAPSSSRSHRSTTVGTASARASDVSLRWVLVHMIEEYARHNGHADLLRERIDGVNRRLSPSACVDLRMRCERRPRRPDRRHGPRCSSGALGGAARRLDPHAQRARASGRRSPRPRRAARPRTTAIAAVTAATCSGDGVARDAVTAACCRACATAAARASCAASRASARASRRVSRGSMTSST